MVANPKLEQRPVSWFRTADDNPRHHPAAKLDDLTRLIRSVGFRVPVLATPDGLLIDGHARLDVARRLKLESIPVFVLYDLDDETRQLLMVAVNQFVVRADWDEAKLSALLRQLESQHIDPHLTGLEGSKIRRLLAPSDEEILASIEITPVDVSWVITIAGPLHLQPRALAVVEELRKIDGVHAHIQVHS